MIMMTPTLMKLKLEPNPPRVNMLKTVNHIEATKGTTGKALQIPNCQTPQGALQAPYSG